MRAWAVAERGHVLLGTRPIPIPLADEVLIRVEACGVCRTDLHVIDGDLPTHRDAVVPGHQIVGRVVERAAAVHSLDIGALVGVPWLRRTCGECEYCRTGRENLCALSSYTGWDADGGYAQYAVAPAAFVYPLPDDADPVEVAPLLCAGIIGYRALERAALPPGGRLGLYGFGSSAHITAQLAMAAGAQVYVMTRGERNRELAGALGVTFVGEERAAPPVPLDSAIVFAPAGELVPVALRATARGGTVALAGIHMSDIPALNYQDDLFYERDLRTVTANTRADGAAFLRLAHTLAIAPRVTRHPFDRVDRALADLRAGDSSGSLVVTLERD